MTTITIKVGDLYKRQFNTPQDLLEFLSNTYSDDTVLVKSTIKDLNPEELAAWQKHKQDGYTDFVDFEE